MQSTPPLRRSARNHQSSSTDTKKPNAPSPNARHSSSKGGEERKAVPDKKCHVIRNDQTLCPNSAITPEGTCAIRKHRELGAIRNAQRATLQEPQTSSPRSSSGDHPFGVDNTAPPSITPGLPVDTSEGEGSSIPIAPFVASSTPLPPESDNGESTRGLRADTPKGDVLSLPIRSSDLLFPPLPSGSTSDDGGSITPGPPVNTPEGEVLSIPIPSPEAISTPLSPGPTSDDGVMPGPLVDKPEGEVLSIPIRSPDALITPLPRGPTSDDGVMPGPPVDKPEGKVLSIPIRSPDALVTPLPRGPTSDDGNSLCLATTDGGHRCPWQSKLGFLTCNRKEHRLQELSIQQALQTPSASSTGGSVGAGGSLELPPGLNRRQDRPPAFPTRVRFTPLSPGPSLTDVDQLPPPAASAGQLEDLRREILGRLAPLESAVKTMELSIKSEDAAARRRGKEMDSSLAPELTLTRQRLEALSKQSPDAVQKRDLEQLGTRFTRELAVTHQRVDKLLAQSGDAVQHQDLAGIEERLAALGDRRAEELLDTHRRFEQQSSGLQDHITRSNQRMTQLQQELREEYARRSSSIKRWTERQDVKMIEQRDLIKDQRADLNSRLESFLSLSERLSHNEAAIQGGQASLKEQVHRMDGILDVMNHAITHGKDEGPFRALARHVNEHRAMLTQLQGSFESRTTRFDNHMAECARLHAARETVDPSPSAGDRSASLTQATADIDLIRERLSDFLKKYLEASKKTAAELVTVRQLANAPPSLLPLQEQFRIFCQNTDSSIAELQAFCNRLTHQLEEVSYARARDPLLASPDRDPFTTMNGITPHGLSSNPGTPPSVRSATGSPRSHSSTVAQASQEQGLHARQLQRVQHLRDQFFERHGGRRN